MDTNAGFRLVPRAGLVVSSEASKKLKLFISQISYSLHWPIVAIYTSLIETNGILPLQPFASWGVRYTKSMAPQIATSQKSLLRPVAQSFGRVSMSVFQMAKQAAEPSKDAWHWPIDLSRLSSIQDLSRSFEIVSKLWSYSPPKRLVQRPRCLKCAVDMLRDPHGLWRSSVCWEQSSQGYPKEDSNGNILKILEVLPSSHRQSLEVDGQGWSGLHSKCLHGINTYAYGQTVLDTLVSTCEMHPWLSIHAGRVSPPHCHEDFLWLAAVGVLGYMDLGLMSEHQCLSEKKDVTVISDDPVGSVHLQQGLVSSWCHEASGSVSCVLACVYVSHVKGFSYQLKAGSLACSRILFIVETDFEAWKQTLPLDF